MHIFWKSERWSLTIPRWLKLEHVTSQAFPQAGTYIMRDGDLYLCFNASGAGINGRGSHGHNDALSIEVSAGGRAFIVDPGTYVYSADLQKRHEFRSTAYHSTVQIDGRRTEHDSCGLALRDRQRSATTRA